MIKLHPSEIHFSQNFLPSDEKGATSSFLSANGSHARALPKLQVFKKSGCFFALDNNALLLYRDMESGGACGTVDVEVVPAKIIPKAVMAATKCCTGDSTSNASRYQKNYAREDGETGAEACTPPGYTSESEEGTDCDDSEGDCYEAIDDLTCVVCNRKFRGVQELTSHQVNKKHFGCYACGDIYPSSKELKEHKEAMRHCSDDDSD